MFAHLDLTMTSKLTGRFFDALELVTSANNAQRSIDNILDYLHHGDKISITEFVGGIQTILRVRGLGRQARIRSFWRFCDTAVTMGSWKTLTTRTSSKQLEMRSRVVC